MDSSTEIFLVDNDPAKKTYDKFLSDFGSDYVDYCMIRCTGEKLNNPVNYIRASWIRPEDLVHYKNIGYENFKIVERLSPTYLLRTRVKAYAGGCYNGNLLDLVQPYGHRDDSKNGFSKLRVMLRYFLRPFSVNLLKMKKIKTLTEKQEMLSSFKSAPPVVIQNEKLNGFIKPFLAESCSDKNCSDCRYCHTVAEKHVQIDPTYRDEYAELYKDLAEEIESGNMWN